MTEARDRREADLIAYYDNEAHDRRASTPDADRSARRDAFVRLLHREGRGSVAEIGTGPGRDAVALAGAGLLFRGVDLAPASVALCRGEGLDVQVGSALALPFRDGEFEAAYTASTLLHIAEDDLDTALGELVRVVVPGSPIAIGVWGAPEARTDEWGDPKYGPARFFAFRSDHGLSQALGRHGTVEAFETWPALSFEGLHYQWAILRTPGLRPTA